jgi:hypothetical protein
VPEPGDLAISLPELNVVTIGKLFRLFCGLEIVGAFEWNRAMKMPVGTDDVNAVFRHVAAPFIRQERDTLSYRGDGQTRFPKRAEVDLYLRIVPQS